MSTSLYWKPVPTPPEGNDLPFELKKILGPRLWDHDGSLVGEDLEVTENLIPYLQGLSDAGIDGVQRLIELIKKYGTIILYIK